jgi:hypothetical protein
VSDDLSGRLARWSQRKQAARHAKRSPAAPTEPENARALADSETTPTATSEGGRPADAGGAAQDRALTTDDRTSGDDERVLPPLEELTADSDYTPFLRKGVPEELTRAALRKLWLSDPIFNTMDGLDTYIQDFNVTDPVITDAQTSYKVGRGYLDEEPAEVEKDDSAAPARTDDHGSDSDDDEAAIATNNEDEQIAAENTSPRPVDAVAWEEAEKMGKAEAEKPREKSNNSER